MDNFQQINLPNSFIKNEYLRFMFSSKPLPICTYRSPYLRKQLIEEYWKFLFSEFDCYYKTDFIIFINKVSGEFALVWGKSSFKLIKDFEQFREFFFLKYPLKEIFSEISREYKKDTFMKCLRLRDRSAKIKMENSKLIVYYQNKDYGIS